GVLMKHVSHSGLKDKWADTVQWFSVQLPGKDNPDVAQFDEPNMTIVQMRRHCKKLRIGAHKENLFVIRMRDIEAHDLLIERLHVIKREGVPNYFGEQRFGLQRRNLIQAEACLLNGRRCKREQRSLYLSAVRSYVFNVLVSHRIEQDTIAHYVPGDVLQLSGSRSCFQADEWNEELQQRLKSGDVSLTAALIGLGGVQAQADSLAFEEAVCAPHTAWLDYVKRIKMKAQRRQMIVRLDDLQWRSVVDDIELAFTLPAGSFATAVLRELITVADPKSHQML
ncbi:MAG: tRNA pseudouridine(13) synthase TruD, partial [Pseudomonadota bacterium]